MTYRWTANIKPPEHVLGSFQKQMMRKPLHPNTNGLLAALSPEQRRHFVDAASRVALAQKKVRAKPKQPTQYVYSPTTAVLSVLSVMTNRVAVETAVVGFEGMAPIG